MASSDGLATHAEQGVPEPSRRQRRHDENQANRTTIGGRFGSTKLRVRQRWHLRTWAVRREQAPRVRLSGIFSRPRRLKILAPVARPPRSRRGLPSSAMTGAGACDAASKRRDAGARDATATNTASRHRYWLSRHYRSRLRNSRSCGPCACRTQPRATAPAGSADTPAMPCHHSGPVGDAAGSQRGGPARCRRDLARAVHRARAPDGRPRGALARPAGQRLCRIVRVSFARFAGVKRNQKPTLYPLSRQPGLTRA